MDLKEVVEKTKCSCPHNTREGERGEIGQGENNSSQCMPCYLVGDFTAHFVWVIF